jgi:hypothetical protein
VRLRLHQRDDAPTGGQVFAISNAAFNERMTWDVGRPNIDGPLLATIGEVVDDEVYEIELGPEAVSGDGAVAFALTSQNKDGARWSSREYSQAPPELFVEVADREPVDGLSQITDSTRGSSNPTYFTNSHRVAVTERGRLLAIHGRHATGVQLAWRDPGGTWETASIGAFLNGLVLTATGTGDWTASIALARDSQGAEHAWVVWAPPSYATTGALQLIRLSELDGRSGPSIDAKTTIGSPTAGTYRPDLAFERGPDGTMRGVVN